MEQIDNIKQLLQPILDRYNAGLVDISLSKSPNRPILRILVDKEGGITLEECSNINRELGDILDKTDSMQGSYVLEISSPGLDRPLKEKKDFEKVMGEEINLHLKESINGKNFYQAKLDSINEEFITLKAKDGRMLKIPYNNIQKANLEIRF